MAQEVKLSSLEDGVYIIGMYTGMREFNNDDGSKRARVSVLTGQEVQQVYLTNDGGGELQAHGRGDDVVVAARPYVNKKGYLSWTGGQIMCWFEDDDGPAGE